MSLPRSQVTSSIRRTTPAAGHSACRGWIHEYSRETGWAIRALCKYYDVTGDASALSRAEKAARWAQTARALPGGGFAHGATNGSARDAGGPYLDDNVAMTRRPSWLSIARRASANGCEPRFATLDFIDSKLRDPHAGYIASPAPSNTRGVFREPIRDVAQNAAVARVANMINHYTGAEQQLRIAKHAMAYLSAFAAAANEQFRPDILLADHELSTAPPIHITVVGGKEDVVAQSSACCGPRVSR